MVGDCGASPLFSSLSLFVVDVGRRAALDLHTRDYYYSPRPSLQMIVVFCRCATSWTISDPRSLNSHSGKVSSQMTGDVVNTSVILDVNGNVNRRPGLAISLRAGRARRISRTRLRVAGVWRQPKPHAAGT